MARCGIPPRLNSGLRDVGFPARAVGKDSEKACKNFLRITPLMVTTTVPPNGGTFSPPAPGNYNRALTDLCTISVIHRRSGKAQNEFEIKAKIRLTHFHGFK